MRILFMGTPHFAVPSLRTVAAEHEVLKVITQPDRPAGRGRKISPPPTKQCAQQLGLPAWQPEKASSPEGLRVLSDLHPDLIVVVGYGQIISQAALDIPALGAVNLHASLLPRYRGAAPVQWAIVNGDKETGVTTMWMTAQLDAGDTILQESVPIMPEDTAGSLGDRLALEGAALLAETLRQVDKGIAPRTPQDETRATFAPRILPRDARIDWRAEAATIWNLVRGLNPVPGAFTFRSGARLKIWQVQALEGGGEGEPGLVTELNQQGFSVCAGRGAVLVKEVQPESRRKMPAAAYARGHRMVPGEILGATEEGADERGRH